jgi:hypothetical protein
MLTALRLASTDRAALTGVLRDPSTIGVTLLSVAQAALATADRVSSHAARAATSRWVVGARSALT